MVKKNKNDKKNVAEDDGAYRRQAPALFVQVAVGAPVVRGGHENTLVPLLVFPPAAALEVRAQGALTFPVDGNLGAGDPTVLVRILVGRDAGERLVDLLLEGLGGGFVLHVRSVVELGVFEFKGGAA